MDHPGWVMYSGNVLLGCRDSCGRPVLAVVVIGVDHAGWVTVLPGVMAWGVQHAGPRGDQGTVVVTRARQCASWTTLGGSPVWVGGAGRGLRCAASKWVCSEHRLGAGRMHRRCGGLTPWPHVGYWPC